MSLTNPTSKRSQCNNVNVIKVRGKRRNPKPLQPIPIGGPFHQIANNNRYIIVTINYFIKWSKAKAVLEASAQQEHLFSKSNDQQITKKIQNKYLYFTSYYPKTNELIEQFNKTLFPDVTWWKENTLRYPSMSSMASYIFAVLITLVVSETIFSMAGRIINDYRSNLTPETV
ncbi:hypothetical protein Glove_202g83 [Diversispora epigaea]|uniref:HAT C-terminal dimerisation domain-containing protein n=1 Tax=Diversispora epigaea TaxID=1348612 RepID=A0A397IJR2_9GLOM|nr:hypothetical protein Glove_202g83 [Diversispora epigaea]